MNDAEIRADILDTAKGYVLNDRNSTYGSPEDNFKRIARRWTAHLRNIGHLGADKEISPTSVAIMMADVKAARLENNPTHKDSWVDWAGYAACGAGIALAEPATQMSMNQMEELSKPKQGESFSITEAQRKAMVEIVKNFPQPPI